MTEDNEACGILMYCMNDDDGSAFIESIYVDSEVRRQGGGTLLVKSFEETTKGRARLAAVRIIPDNEDELKGFFGSLGYSF